MGLVNLLVLTWLAILAQQSVALEDECFGHPRYVRGCDGETYSERQACDCDGTTCYFKLIITSAGKGGYDVLPVLVITVNGLFQGPTIIVNQGAEVVVDVVNNMHINSTSVHWHGMHQQDTPWIDGVSYITQWAIQPGGKFRYIFRATPSGTFWYHSHERDQREFGFFGALIVKETAADLSFYGDFEDKSDEHTLVFLDFVKRNISDYTSKVNAFTSLFARNDKSRQECLPDGSKLANSEVGTSAKISINGKSLPLAFITAQQGHKVPEINPDSLEIFYVKTGKTYRFRLIAAMEGTPYRFSIDEHILTVIATDGYLVKPYETDYIIIHVGERFDFLLTANATRSNETQFPVRTETLTVDCISGKNLNNSGFAALIYGSEKNVAVNIRYLISQFRKPDPKGCSNSSLCKVLNCPFGAYKKELHLECHHVDELQLLHPTAENDVPDSANLNFTTTKFFNFKYNSSTKIATINGKQFTMPPIALEVSYYEGKINECYYDTTCSSASNNACVHIVDIPQRHYNKGIRFVLSTLGENFVTYTHPIHLHGHSFHVVKIGFPDYYDNGTIKNPNKDLQPDTKCDGPPNWKDNTVPDGLNTNITTVRKDTIMVPAGGYVVIDFIADNPGYWFMHCHIDHHLIDGMAVVIRELKDCENEPPSDLMKNDTDFCWNVADYENATSPDHVPDCANPPSAIQHGEVSSHFKEREDYTFEKKINRLKKQQAMEKRGRMLPKDKTGFTGSSKHRLEEGAFRPSNDRAAWKLEDRAFRLSKDRRTWRLKPFNDYRRFREEIHTSAKERPMLSYWDNLPRKKGMPQGHN